jgi:hypothetical protein
MTGKRTRAIDLFTSRLILKKHHNFCRNDWHGRERHQSGILGHLGYFCSIPPSFVAVVMAFICFWSRLVLLLFRSNDESNRMRFRFEQLQGMLDAIGRRPGHPWSGGRSGGSHLQSPCPRCNYIQSKRSNGELIISFLRKGEHRAIMNGAVCHHVEARRSARSEPSSLASQRRMRRVWWGIGVEFWIIHCWCMSCERRRKNTDTRLLYKVLSATRADTRICF